MATVSEVRSRGYEDWADNVTPGTQWRTVQVLFNLRRDEVSRIRMNG